MSFFSLAFRCLVRKKNFFSHLLTKSLKDFTIGVAHCEMKVKDYIFNYFDPYVWLLTFIII